MSEITIYHNPRCSKSRATLALLEDRGLTPKVVHYLEQPPSAGELRELLALLGIGARNLMRQSEPIYTELGLAAVGDEDTLIDAMHQHPILIERPIVRVAPARDGAAARATIGRPPENVLALL